MPVVVSPFQQPIHPLKDGIGGWFEFRTPG
jgi:hypothetical protein